MAVKLISYDLGIPEASTSYRELISYIESLGDSIRPLKSFFLVDTMQSCKSIRDGALKLLDRNDRFIVMEVDLGIWATYGLPNSVLEWMHKH
ncbi:SinR-like protein [Candidatus Saccharibacteria bacterium]|nr:SinR-like protein [Candidatus Saccharibacteria bacterium]